MSNNDILTINSSTFRNTQGEAEHVDRLVIPEKGTLTSNELAGSFANQQNYTQCPYAVDSFMFPQSQGYAILEKQWIDGVILIPGRTGEDAQYRQYMEHLSRMRKRDTAIPVVLVEAGDCGAGLDQVCVDHEAAFACLAEHLLELGRRRIAFLGDCGGAPMSRQELSGIRKVLDTAGCGLPDSLVNMGNSTVRDGFQAMETLLLEGAKPDGVICANDQVAAGALGACKEHGLSVPADIAVTGYGGMALSIVTDPAITTMIAPRRRLGSRAAELLYERIEGMSGGPRRETLTAHAAVRCSTMRSATRGLETMFDD